MARFRSLDDQLAMNDQIKKELKEKLMMTEENNRELT